MVDILFPYLVKPRYAGMFATGIEAPVANSASNILSGEKSARANQA
jgi:hypothetical protein